MLNKVVLIGRLTRDPELRSTTSNISVTTFTLAVDRRFTISRAREADFIPIVTWRSLAETCHRYLKGKACSRIGRIQVRNYEEATGKGVILRKWSQMRSILEKAAHCSDRRTGMGVPQRSEGSQHHR